MRTIIASISAEQGPAKLTDIDAANAAALNVIILATFMASLPLVWCAGRVYTTPKTIPLMYVNRTSAAALRIIERRAHATFP